MTDTSTPTAHDDEYAVIVTLPEHDGDVPIETERVRRVGPYWRASAAEQAACSFRMMLHGSAPQGTTVDVGPYDPAVPHLEARVTTDYMQLAEMIRDEPEGPGCGWSFPDLYARLQSHAGHDAASRAWRAACSLLDQWAEEEQAERKAAADREARAAELEVKLAPLRARVDGAAALRAFAWYTAPIRDAAVWLLYDMLAAAEPRGVTLADFGQVADLPAICLDMVATTSISADRLPGRDGAVNLLYALETELGERGIKATRTGLVVQTDDERLRLVSSSPAYHGAPLSITLSGGPVWRLLYAGTMARNAPIYAPFDGSGVAAIADMIAELANGKRPNPLER